MTIRRQYSLPNCTLVLDGLSDGNSISGTPDPRPLMSSLFNAECHFVGAERHLFGGRDFLTSLVTAVSNYAQEFLSGVPHPHRAQSANSLVSIAKGDRDNLHHLSATLEADSQTGTDAGSKTTELNLSTIQLFDLLEAIDQFLADKRTLPDLTVPFQPVSKAIAKPMAKQAVPAGLGLASLVAASLIGYALPSPKVSQPQSIAPPPAVQPTTKPTSPPSSTPPAAGGSPQSSATPTPTATSSAPPAAATSNSPAAPTADNAATPSPQASPSATPTATSTPQSSAGDTPAATKTGTIVEATQIGFLERKLQRDINQNWQQRGKINKNVGFNVKVNQDGEIVNYQVVNNANADASNLTPLPKLKTKTTNPNQAIGNFSVVFKPNGLVNVSPAEKLQGEMTLGKKIGDAKLQGELATKLKTTLQQSLGNKQPLDRLNLRYRVGVTQTGEIADYEPLNVRAFRQEGQTPLPKLTKFNAQAAISQEPLAHYDVVFQPNGQISVTATK